MSWAWLSKDQTIVLFFATSPICTFISVNMCFASHSTQMCMARIFSPTPVPQPGIELTSALLHLSEWLSFRALYPFYERVLWLDPIKLVFFDFYVFVSFKLKGSLHSKAWAWPKLKLRRPKKNKLVEPAQANFGLVWSREHNCATRCCLFSARLPET